MPERPIDLRSDTVTRPTAAMRRAIAEAEVGDDVLDGDPTARQLEERTAAMLGKERALFFPSGTMANQTAIWVAAERGSEIYADAGAHVVHYEMAAAAALGGVQIRTVAPSGDIMSAEDFESLPQLGSAGQSSSHRARFVAHAPASRIAHIEQTRLEMPARGRGGAHAREPLGALAPLEDLRVGIDEDYAVVHRVE